MSLADTVLRFSSPYTVTRTATGTKVKGRYTEGTPTTFEISAVVQPLGGRELLRLPEGEKTRERLVVFTTTPLFSGDVPDKLSIGADTWQVENVEDWQAHGGFLKATVVKVTD
jgi:hypothetical protein